MTDQQRRVQDVAALNSFNARTMAVNQIVDSFIEPPAFAQLIQPVNSLLCGPRGSGKTTMMKMLQPRALDLWTGERADIVRGQIDYLGVFVATDRTWKSQLQPKVQESRFGPEIELVGQAAFTSHVLREIISTMRYKLGSSGADAGMRHLADSESLPLVKALARVAGIEETEPSLFGLEIALSTRMSNLFSLQTRLREERKFDLPSFVGLECLSVATAAIDIFNRFSGHENLQWALLFDEMELAPTKIVTSLLDAMRGQPENLILKLSLSPVQPELSVLHRPFAGTDGQDFDLIQLSYAKQNDSLDLGRKMLMAEARRRGVNARRPQELIGVSDFSSLDDGGGGMDRREYQGRGNPYASNSKLWQKYKSLSDSDESFRAYLARRGIDLQKLESLSPVERAARLRKVRNIVVVREFYRKVAFRRRSRKSYSLYSGADTLILLCDGNARLLKALSGELFSSAEPAGLPIRRDAQSRVVESIISRFRNLIYSAEAVERADGRCVTLDELVDRIGAVLASGLIDEPFTDDPILTFVVDRKVSTETIQLLRIGINAGVFVHIAERSDNRVPLDLIGERFRLSYVLAPFFGLPVRLGRKANLSTLLGKSFRLNEAPTTARSRQPAASQLALLLDLEPSEKGLSE